MKEITCTLWYGHEKGLTAMQRRILITHWVGNVWATLYSPEYENLGKRCWEKTGCLVTADGFEDNKIRPEGLKDYEIPPPLTIPSVGAEPASNLPHSSHGEDEDHEEVLNADVEHPPNEGLE